MKEIKGDLIKQAKEFDVIIHGCNCFKTMGAGIALQIKNKFPEAYKKDVLDDRISKDKLGSISYTENTAPIIVNAYTQFNPGADVSYDAIRKSMKEIKIKFTGKKIGLPMIGAGIAGGNWSIISEIIKYELKGEDVTVIIWDKDYRALD